MPWNAACICQQVAAKNCDAARPVLPRTPLGPLGWLEPLPSTSTEQIAMRQHGRPAPNNTNPELTIGDFLASDSMGPLEPV